MSASDGPAEPIDMRCGSYCLYIAMESVKPGLPRYEEFEKTIGPPHAAGYSLEDLRRTAVAHGFEAVAVDMDPHALARMYEEDVRCILLLKTGHFVLLETFGTHDVGVIDPPDAYTMRRELFDELWTGKALLMSDAPLPAWAATSNRLTIALSLAAAIAIAVSITIWRLRPWARSE